MLSGPNCQIEKTHPAVPSESLWVLKYVFELTYLESFAEAVDLHPAVARWDEENLPMSLREHRLRHLDYSRSKSYEQAANLPVRSFLHSGHGLRGPHGCLDILGLFQNEFQVRSTRIQKFLTIRLLACG